jgi:hypothetical protein
VTFLRIPNQKYTYQIFSDKEFKGMLALFPNLEQNVQVTAQGKNNLFYNCEYE